MCLNLNSFRDFFSEKRNLANAHLRVMNFGTEHRKRAWLTVTPRLLAPVVFARSERHRDGGCFPWGELRAKYHGRSAFVGTVAEHADFAPVRSGAICRSRYAAGRGGNYRRCPTIPRATGNAKEAIAEGLKQNKIIEVDREFPFGSRFNRVGEMLVDTRKDWEFPDV